MMNESEKEIRGREKAKRRGTERKETRKDKNLG